MSETIGVTLPSGVRVGGRLDRVVRLRPLCGRDEAALAEMGGATLPVEKATQLLVRCVERIGECTSITKEAIENLTVGDREALMLHVRRLAFGDTLSCLVLCPMPECEERLEWNMQIGDILSAPYEQDACEREIRIDADDGEYTVRFRLPTGADQTLAAHRALKDPRCAEELLLERCILDVASGLGEQIPSDQWPRGILEALPERLADLDPQAELEIDLVCPSCGHRFSTVFDTSIYLFRELVSRSEDLYHEVHTLAYHYHWGEREIMDMPPRRRRHYLDLLLSELGRSEES